MKKLTLITAIVLTGSLVLSCSGGKPKEGPPVKTETVFAVNVTEAVAGELSSYLRINADVRNTSTVDVYAETAGKVVNMAVALGNFVQAGQVIAWVDPSRPGMEYVASPVRTPISGTVVAVPAALGATVSPQVPIARISRNAETRLVADIAEKYIASIHVGLEAIVSFEAFPGKTFAARVIEVAPEVDAASRTLQIKLRIDDPDPRIKVGMFTMVKLITDKKTGVVKIPSDAVIQRLGSNFVFVVKDNKAQLRKVALGLSIDGKQEIVNGLTPGEIIVVRGQTLLDEGSKVNIIEKVPSLSTEDKVE